jgi:hypothetical protein
VPSDAHPAPSGPIGCRGRCGGAAAHVRFRSPKPPPPPRADRCAGFWHGCAAPGLRLVVAMWASRLVVSNASTPVDNSNRSACIWRPPNTRCAVLRPCLTPVRASIRRTGALKQPPVSIWKCTSAMSAGPATKAIRRMRSFIRRRLLAMCRFRVGSKRRHPAQYHHESALPREGVLDKNRRRQLRKALRRQRKAVELGQHPVDQPPGICAIGHLWTLGASQAASQRKLRLLTVSQ